MVLVNKPINNRSRSIRWLAAVSLVLAGCSKTEFLYRNADWFIERWTDNLVSLSDEQKSEWRVGLEQTLARHRKLELPAVVALMSAMEYRAAGPLTGPEVQCLVDQTEQLFRRHARLAAGAAAPLLVRLSPRQLDELERGLAERDAGYREEYLIADSEERAERREQRFLKRIERWTGRLEQSQRDLVRSASRETPDLALPWLNYRKGRQQLLLELLRTNTEQESIRQFLVSWWVDLAGRPDALRRSTDAATLGFVELLSRLSFTLSSEQRETLVGRVRELRTGLGVVLKPEALRVANAEGIRICVAVGS